MTDYIVEMSYEDTKECFESLTADSVDFGMLSGGTFKKGRSMHFDHEYNKLDIGILQYKIRKYGVEEHFNNPRRLNQKFIEENIETESQVLAQLLFEETQRESTATYLGIKWGFALRDGDTVNEGLTIEDDS